MPAASIDGKYFQRKYPPLYGSRTAILKKEGTEDEGKEKVFATACNVW